MTTAINKVYTRADIVTKETVLGGWGLTSSKDKYLVSVYFSADEFKALQDAIKLSPPSSRLNYLTFDVTANINNEIVHDSIVSYVDILPPEIVGVTTSQNQSAKLILKALDIFKNDPLENNYIEALTSADSGGIVYIRNDSINPNYVTFRFTIYDDNPANETLKYYENAIHAKIASNFIGQNIVTTYTSYLNNKFVDVTISGELKTDTLLRTISIQDSLGNSTELKVIDAVIQFLPDPLPLNVNLINGQYNDYTDNPLVDISPKSFVKGTRNDYDLGFANTSFANGKIVGLVLPFTQDITNVDNKNITEKFGNIANITKNLNYETFKAASIYPTLNNNISISGYLDKVNVLSRNGTKIYDGIYGMQSILPVNRAGGIASFIYNDTKLQAIKDVDTDINLVDSIKNSVNGENIGVLIITPNLKYVVDTVPPELIAIYKTGVVLKDDTTTYKNGIDFNVITKSNTLGSNLTYQASIFTGKVKDFTGLTDFTPLDAKPGDIYTIALKDFSLGLKNTDPGDFVAGTSTNANAKFYTYKIMNDSNFTYEDLANNVNPSSGNIGTIIINYPIINGVSYGTNIKGPDDLENNTFNFTNLKDNLILHNTFAGAASSTVITGAIGTVLKDYNLMIPPVIFDINGEKQITTYSFTSAGWVKSELNSIIYDTEINTTNKTLPQVTLIKTGTNTWEGEIYFGDTYEYVGLRDFTIIDKGKSTDISPTSGTFIVNSSNTIARTETAALSRTDVTKSVNFTYNTTLKIPTDTVYIKLTDKLGNTGIFNLKLLISNPLYLIGTSANSNKQIKSTVDINNSKKIIIKGVTEQNK